jgi:hypothetical protein
MKNRLLNALLSDLTANDKTAQDCGGAFRLGSLVAAREPTLSGRDAGRILTGLPGVAARFPAARDLRPAGTNASTIHIHIRVSSIFSIAAFSFYP